MSVFVQAAKQARNLSCCWVINDSLALTNNPIIPCRHVMIYLCSEKVKNCVYTWWNCFHPKKKKKEFLSSFSNSCDLLPKERELFALESSIIWQRSSLSVGWTNAFGGRVGSLVSFKLHRQSSLLFWKNIREERVFRFSDLLNSSLINKFIIRKWIGKNWGTKYQFQLENKWNEHYRQGADEDDGIIKWP